MTLLLDDVSLLRALRYRAQFPGSYVHPRADIKVAGEFTHERCIIGPSTLIEVPARSALHLGAHCYIGRSVEIGPNGTIAIAEGTSIQDRCILLGNVRIGRYCTFAPNVYISSGRHYYDLVPEWHIKDQDAHVHGDPALASTHHRAVTIEDDCWLGINAVVMAGVTIGKGSVVGANAVVTRDVAPYSVVAGAPAKLIKRRLVFEPPSAVDYRQGADHPYFYSGFKLSRDELAAAEPHGGVRSLPCFSLYLDQREKATVSLDLKLIGETEGLLRCGEAEARVTRGACTVSFPLPAGAAPGPIRFEFAGASELYVEKAWVA